jgi:hypothetical protein
MDLARQPLFRLIAATIVILLADMNPVYGCIAAVAWIVWVYYGSQPKQQRNRNP